MKTRTGDKGSAHMSRYGNSLASEMMRLSDERDFENVILTDPRKELERYKNKKKDGDGNRI